VVLGATILAAFFLLPRVPLTWEDPAKEVLGDMMEINLLWPLLNLLPIWPLDGGQMAREVFVAASPRNGSYVTLVVSAGIAGLAAFHCAFPHVLGAHVPLLDWPRPEFYMAMFFALFCGQSIMGLMAENARRQRQYNEEEEFPWER
jgi:stage IV sporulation protein FB